MLAKFFAAAIFMTFGGGVVFVVVLGIAWLGQGRSYSPILADLAMYSLFTFLGGGMLLSLAIFATVIQGSYEQGNFKPQMIWVPFVALCVGFVVWFFVNGIQKNWRDTEELKNVTTELLKETKKQNRAAGIK